MTLIRILEYLRYYLFQKEHAYVEAIKNGLRTKGFHIQTGRGYFCVNRHADTTYFDDKGVVSHSTGDEVVKHLTTEWKDIS